MKMFFYAVKLHQKVYMASLFKSNQKLITIWNTAYNNNESAGTVRYGE